jgi:hypothetical protein
MLPLLVQMFYTVIYFRPKLREFLRFPLNQNFRIDLIFRSFGRKKSRKQHPNNFGLNTRNSGFQKHEVSDKKNEVSVRKTRSFGSKIPKFRFKNPEVSVRKPEVSVQNAEILVRKPEVSVQNSEVSVKIFRLETSVKVVFRNVFGNGNPKFLIIV